MITGVKRRDTRLDAIRGVLLIIMAAVHVPTPLSHLLQEPFGFTSAAEGFIFLGAALAGYVYGKSHVQAGWTVMSGKVWARARWVYFIHLAMLVPAVALAWVASNRLAPLANQFHDFLAHPWGSLVLMPLLLHQPPLFDILPLYVIFLGLTPLLLAAARRRGWGIVLAVSALGWLMAQFKLDARVLGDPSRLLPLRLGSFDLAAWQFLWVAGLAVGETAFRRPLIRREWRPGLGAVSLVIVLVGLLSRHGLWPQAWFSQDLYLWMDKWTLGPLRLLNFAAWVALLLAWNPALLPPLLSPVALLGRHSLAVFSFHVPLAIGATILIQTGSLSSVPQILIGLLVIATLFPWAAWQERHSRRRDRANATLAAAAAVASAGAAGEKQATPANWAEVPAPG